MQEQSICNLAADMNLFLALLTCVALTAAKSLFEAPTKPLRYYHENVGIAEAERIRRAEAKADGENAGAEANAGMTNERIVGGSAAALGAYPFMGGLVITLTTGEISVCGSSLLTNTRAVTAAHCWWDGRTQARQFTVVLGSTYLFTGGLRVNTDSIQLHASWNPNNLINDIAIVTILPVTYTNTIRPVTLPSGTLLTNNFTGWTAFTAGFGRTSEASGIAPDQYLSHVQLQVIANTVCQTSFGQNIAASMLCTSGAGGIGTCGGDAGGPLVITHDHQHVLIGISSFGSALGCTRGFPVVFSRVTSFNTWIRDLL